MPELLVTMTVKFDNPAIYTKWMPLDESDTIVVAEGGLSLAMIHKLESAWWAAQSTRDDIECTYNNSAHRLFVEVRTEVSTALAAFILAKQRSDGALQDEYLALGRRMQALIVKQLNRLAEYLGAMKGQYWIDRFEPNDLNPSQFFIAREARAIIEGQTVHFDPQIRTIITASLPRQSAMIAKDDWPAIRDFVAGDRSTPLVHSLLSSANRLASQGLRRNALVDGVTALEVALNDFARRADTARLSRFQPGLEPKSLPALIDKVGLRGAFGVAIPLLFTVEEFPVELLEDCRAAIERRNHIVHQGARDVGEPQLNKLLAAIGKACEKLASFTEPGPG
jgi:hypothetical protein